MRINETSRLYMREMIITDTQSVYDLNLDPDVIKYTGDVAFKNLTDARDFLLSYNHYEKYGFGRWAVIRKSDGAFLGWCGLKYTAETGEYDIGYRLHKRYWGMGYATEAAQACLRWGFQNIKTDIIIGRAISNNIASVNVLEKIGMKHTETKHINNSDFLIYEIHRAIIT